MQFRRFCFLIWAISLNHQSVIRTHLLRFVCTNSLLTALVRLPTYAMSFHLDVARYAFDETAAHLINNRTKSVKDSNDRLWLKQSLELLSENIYLSRANMAINFLTVLEEHDCRDVADAQFGSHFVGFFYVAL